MDCACTLCYPCCGAVLLRHECVACLAAVVIHQGLCTGGFQLMQRECLPLLCSAYLLLLQGGALQLGWPDMRLPILYTMSWPERIPCSEKTWSRLDFLKMGDLTFKNPDNEKYPAMDLAYAAGRAGGTMTGVLSAANEQVPHVEYAGGPAFGRAALCIAFLRMAESKPSFAGHIGHQGMTATLVCCILIGHHAACMRSDA